MVTVMMSLGGPRTVPSLVWEAAHGLYTRPRQCIVTTSGRNIERGQVLVMWPQLGIGIQAQLRSPSY